ncbi:MAG: hypothetical protein M3Y68_13715 [Chloroflexota bacterium]|nr:hypothetical protein [Chloroflexota bacterium]
MAKKNRFKHLIEKNSSESADVPPEREEATPVEQDETTLPASDTDQEMAAPARDEEELTEAQARLSAEADEAEDALDDVRRALIEDETEEKTQKESRWWRRMGRKEKPAEAEESVAPLEIDLPRAEELVSPSETSLPDVEEPEEDIEELDDLIDLLEGESRAAAPESPAAPAAEVLPEPEIDFEELKRQAFQSRPEDAEQQSLSDVRSIAMEGGEDVMVEVETRPVDPVEERLRGFENALKPYRRYLYSAMAVLGIGMAVVAALILFNVYQRSRPEPVREAPDLPYPTAVSLPGGWTFQLGIGSVQNGEWDPSGAEWLEGTEVCRWVALPWSTQLEAVLRTLNPDDPIQLVMSNNDVLTYEVYSIRQLNAEQMQQLDSNSPCLLLILTGAGTEERWVLTALP